jgi:hypothetical protein
MFKYPLYNTIFATVYLLVFITLLHLNYSSNLLYILFFFSPFVVLMLAWSILRHGKYSGRYLAKDEHWGYQDKMHKKA